MYCPACGKPNSDTQRFCTSCGQSLDLFCQMLAAQANPPEGVRSVTGAGRLAFWQNPLIYGLALMAFGFFITAAGIFAFRDRSFSILGEIIAGLGAFLIFAKGMSHIALTVGAAQQNRMLELKGSQNPRRTGAGAQRFISSPAASVTESTTKHLDLQSGPRQDAAPNTQPDLQI
ncbi:MAG TPA: zinc ribbon domain-containing protein [Blastocatellia bacterium]